ncbi:putative membrane protein [Babesia divergens]|uniref:Membrane protein n=1 Tax=Babesia divergens TaxID=32595 RepID=A0AAD9GDL6_BABDI|nr:putative membrane protein [Babesia divergens]
MKLGILYVATLVAHIKLSFAYHPFIHTLDVEAFREVQRLHDLYHDSKVIRLCESTYRNLVLPGNSHFKAIVLFVDMRNHHHIEFLSMFKDIAHELHKYNEKQNENGHGKNNIFNFYVDVSDDSTEWIIRLHGMHHLPDVLHFGLGKTVQSGDFMDVPGFNAWIMTKATPETVWTSTMLFKQLLQFCHELPAVSVMPASFTQEVIGLLKDISSWFFRRKSLICCLLLSAIVLLYTLYKHRRELLMACALVLYLANMSCILSSLVMHIEYGNNVLRNSGNFISDMLNRLFTNSPKTQFAYECIIVSLLALTISVTLMYLCHIACDCSYVWLFGIVGLFGILVSSLILILNHKEQYYSFYFLPEKHLTRGGIHQDQRLLF